MNPSVAKPAENVTACCSAIPTSNILFGNFFANKSIPVPDGIAAVIPIILLSLSACLINVLAKTLVYDGILELDFSCTPVFILNFETPWYLSFEFSAN